MAAASTFDQHWQLCGKVTGVVLPQRTQASKRVSECISDLPVKKLDLPEPFAPTAHINQL